MTEQVDPNHSTGNNFSKPALRQQYLSTKKQVWGQEFDPAWDPVTQSCQTTSTGGRHCAYCGFAGHGQSIDSVNDHHGDVSPENQVPADKLCHSWHHLGELGEGNGVITYLPQLDPQDVVHLQRTILISTRSPNEQTRATAKRLLNWLASHNRYVTEIWGSSDPQHFAAAFRADHGDPRDRQMQACNDLALVVNPRLVAAEVAAWAQDVCREHPEDDWPEMANDILNSTGHW